MQCPVRIAACFLVGLTLALIHGSEARAAFVLRITTASGGSATIQDNSSLDSSSTAGVIVFNYDPNTQGQLLGPNFAVTVTTGLSKPATMGSAQPYPLMDLNSVQLTTFGAAVTDTVTIQLMDTDFESGQNVFLHSMVGGTLTAPANSWIDFETYIDPTNSQILSNIVLDGAGGYGPGAFSTQTVTPVSIPTGVFSMTQVATIHFENAAPGIVSFDFESKVVPEPASIAIWCVGLAGAVGLAHFRRRRV